jgi:hypothetical protein
MRSAQLISRKRKSFDALFRSIALLFVSNASTNAYRPNGEENRRYSEQEQSALEVRLRGMKWIFCRFGQ